MMKLFVDILTGIDGESFDIIRVLALVSVAMALALEAYVVICKGQPFDVQAFGIGMGAVFAAAGAALAMKSKTEPEPKP